MSSKECENDRYLTTNQGSPICDDNNSLTVGKNGPVLIQDSQLIEKLAHFDRERIPERVVHAKGAGAHGKFKCYKSMEKYTKAKFLCKEGKETPVFVRFSTVIGGRGSADTVRDPRGFAVKFYTEEGNYDIVGNDLPVFFIRDAIKFPDVIHALKPSPDTNIQDPERYWDFFSNTPEATNMLTWLYSDRGTIKSYRKIEGFGVNTYVWKNKYGERVYIKYHWKPLEGIETITREEAIRLAGTDPDVAVRDLYDTLECGKVVEYELYVQIMELDEACNQYFNPLDDTKIWPEEDFPLIKVGKMTLTHNPKNFFAEVEQAAFCPANVVPGIEFSADKMLQGRGFSYLDTQRYRVGINFIQLPINKPRVKVDNNMQDGSMNFYPNKGKVNYFPSSLEKNPKKEAPCDKDDFLYIEGEIVRKVIDKEENFRQAGERYRSFTKKEQDNLIHNIVMDLCMVNENIQRKMVKYFTCADKEYGTRVKKGLGL